MKLTIERKERTKLTKKQYALNFIITFTTIALFRFIFGELGTGSVGRFFYPFILAWIVSAVLMTYQAKRAAS